jgi:hypothetical protein
MPIEEVIVYWNQEEKSRSPITSDGDGIMSDLGGQVYHW